MEEKKGSGIGKSMFISLIILIAVVLVVILCRALKLGTDVLFIGLLCWVKCFDLDLNPKTILKCWTGAGVGLLIWLANYFTTVKFGTVAGLVVLLVLVYIQIIFDVRNTCDWLVNAAEPIMLTLFIALSAFLPMKTIVYDFCGAFVIAGLIPIIIGAILQSRKKSAA